jgi:hypothetical protein
LVVIHCFSAGVLAQDFRLVDQVARDFLRGVGFEIEQGVGLARDGGVGIWISSKLLNV